MTYMEFDGHDEVAIPDSSAACTESAESNPDIPQDDARQDLVPGKPASDVPASDGSDQSGAPAEASEESPTSSPEGLPSSLESPPLGDAQQEADTSPATKPKRKRPSRKKAAEDTFVPSDEGSPEGTPAGSLLNEESCAADLIGSSEADAPGGSHDILNSSDEESGESPDTETSAFVLEAADVKDGPEPTPEGVDIGEPAEVDSPAPSEEPPPAQASPPQRPRRTSSAGKGITKQFASRPLSDKPSLLSLDLNKLDQDLTEDERNEWNAIYASYRSKSLLTGKIMGIDTHGFTVRNRETGQTERRRMQCAVIISYRVKVLIPETEMWLPGQERPPYVLRNMSGAEIDYTILDIDREGSVAIGSRRMAVMARRHFFDTAKNGHELGERLTCRILSVGPKRCLVECGGRDMNLSQKDLTYTATPDLRERYHPGQTLDCILKEYDRQTGQLWISVKETTANPFFGAIKRHPIGSRRQAVISGKYGGGVFCTLPDETVCLCLYSTRHSDSDFHIGDTVILAIKQFDHDRNLIYGRILSKW